MRQIFTASTCSYNPLISIDFSVELKADVSFMFVKLALLVFPHSPMQLCSVPALSVTLPGQLISAHVKIPSNKVTGTNEDESRSESKRERYVQMQSASRFK